MHDETPVIEQQPFRAGPPFAVQRAQPALLQSFFDSIDRDKLMTAVSEVVKEFHEEIVRQTKQIEKTTASSSVGSATPQVQLHFSTTGVDALVRYPVQLQHEAEIDERVSKELMKVIASSAADASRGS